MTDHIRTLSHDEASRFYDGFGARLDRQGFYEDPAFELLIEQCELSAAVDVVELGTGTGKLAERLLADELPQDAHYRGFDSSSTMVELARERLARFGERATVAKTSGEPELTAPTDSADVFLATYVLDLLSEEDIRRAIREGKRIVRPGGLLGLVSLTHGATLTARLVEKVWCAVHRRRPERLGGCRPIRLTEFVDQPRFAETVTAWGISSEVLVVRV